MFVETIDGNTADVSNDGCTWVSADMVGNQISGTFDEITVKAGETIRFIYTVVPDFD